MKTLTPFEKIAQKNKRKNRLKTVLLTCLIMILAFGIVIKGLTELASTNGNKVKDRYLLMTEIAYPNIFYNDWFFTPTSSFSGQFQSNRYKNIDGIDVPYEKMEANYSIRLSSSDMNVMLVGMSDKKSLYTHTNYYKTPLFYNVKHTYNDEDNVVTQDITLAKDMPNQAIEMAVTFDKPYTYEEISKMLPNNLMANWYWTGTTSTYDTSSVGVDALLGIGNDDTEGLDEAIFSNFKNNITIALKNNYLNSTYGISYSNSSEENYSLKKDAEYYIKHNTSLKTAQFSGVILTGRSENFEQLQGKDWIYGANLGQSVIIQPYYTLVK